MTRRLFTLLALSLLPLALYADDRGKWSGPYGQATVDVDPGPFDQDVSVTFQGIKSGTVKATPDISGDAWDVEESDTMRVTVDGSEYQFRFKRGKLQVDSGDGWKTMRPPLVLGHTEGAGTLPDQAQDL